MLIGEWREYNLLLSIIALIVVVKSLIYENRLRRC